MVLAAKRWETRLFMASLIEYFNRFCSDMEIEENNLKSDFRVVFQICLLPNVVDALGYFITL